MKKKFATYLIGFVLGALLLGSCSRPVAYFQRAGVARYTSEEAVATTQNTTRTEQSALPVDPPSTVEKPALLAVEPTQAMEQVDAYVRSDNRLATNKRLTERLTRMKHLMSEATMTKSLSSATAAHKTTVMERLMLKKIDKKISKRLAPNEPNKPMINGGLLVGSLILLLAGILLVLLTTGTVATIGLLAAIIGAIGLIFGLLAS